MTEVVSDQSSVVSGGTADPLAEAICPHCGYSLRGLPEHRCPECGNAFDPAEVLATFRPKWPVLMKWYLLAYVVSSAVSSPFIISSLLSFRRSTQPSSPFFFTHTLPTLARDLVFVLLGAVAALGLHRHREWGRRIGLAVFACACLSWVLPVPLAVAFFSPSPFAGSDLLLFGLNQWTTAVPACLMIIFLATGLRRHSLARRSDEETPRLLHEPFRPRNDWPLLVVIIFVGMAMLETWGAIGCWSISRYARQQGLAGSESLRLAVTVVAAASAVWLWASAILQWRRPQAVRGLLVVNLVALVLGSASERAAEYLTFPSPGPLTREVVSALLRSQASLLPPLSLLIFVFRDLTDNDLRLVRRLRR